MKLAHRCAICGHRSGKRVVSATSKLGAEPRLHKKPCNCECHFRPEGAQP